MSMNNNYLYAARDKSTGKLVSNLTSKHKKFWQRRDDCLKAINEANQQRLRWNCYNRGELELVTFEIVEVKNDETGIK